MAQIDLCSVSVSFPVYNISARSFKKKFLRLATGGRIVKDANQHVIINALNNISLNFRHGDRVGLIGHNGAGKSTLLRLLANIYEPSQGDISIDGRVTPILDLMLGMESELTGYDNIILRGTLMGLSRQEITDQIDNIAAVTGLNDYLAMPTRTYSAGMLMRLAFAISTTLSPQILIIDEIFGVGDADFREKAHQRMNVLLDQASIVVMANHADEIIKEFCNKAVLLVKGHVEYVGSVTEAFERYYQSEPHEQLNRHG